MIPRHLGLLPAGLMLLAFADPAAERPSTRSSTLADTDRPIVRSRQSAPMPVEEAPLFRIDPKGPPAAMVADTVRRAHAAQKPMPITEERRRR